MKIVASSRVTFLILLGFCLAFGSSSQAHPDLKPFKSWLNHGGGLGLKNQRVAMLENHISAKSVSKLSLNWEFATESDVTATPAISDGVVYFPDWNGFMYAVEQETGNLIWKKNLLDLTSGFITFVPTNITKFYPKTMVSRSTPTIVGDMLVFGVYGPCAVVALCKASGALLWTKELDSHPYALISMSGTAFEGAYYIGTSSLEEGIDGIDCCIFQGAFYKLDVKTGDIIYKVPMLPDNAGQTGRYAGVAIWGSSPSIDVHRRRVFIATGNAYSTPPDIDACLENERNSSSPPFPDVCLPPDDHQESILAIDMASGNVTWSRQLGGYDTFSYVCAAVNPPDNCQAVNGPDYDFGMCPMLMKIATKSAREPAEKPWKEIAVAGQKSGFIWALDQDNGEVVWVTAAGPGGYIGGSSWGLTTDGQRVFTNMINNLKANFTLLPSSTVVQSGGWVAINATNGDILWSTADPFASTTNAPLTYANGVVFGGSVEPGNVVALDAKTGKVLWTYATPGSIYGGVSIADGCVFVPVGNSLIGVNNAPNNVKGKSVLSLCI
ncbi:polyvinyl alcohol dehydrogenase (cytochrome) [Marchantia polymorpha subsp. ruderalis]|uniref:Pyrrolo-quinoline quinone repeat domain-containing protein n=2 Tax=Marchantia polymorpha TaxID=3197 RepID=A0AAF6ASA6_MARPO|nr:hypothetical protein MARPO_0001s0382 [Marchantia polymorpha]BBM99326.1 hypothetical protein Mp_1g20460 [Marchantia polymorpha subsp. ruderalis]|eukprot:PTQ50408.1 hypothetical protein MARPO_0001s0382 [Marchantia polymorpha]